MDGFKVSDYDSGGMMGGYLVNIRIVRDGVHQSYSVMSLNHNGGNVVFNRRDVNNWYETSANNFKLLMDYFGELPQNRP